MMILIGNCTIITSIIRLCYLVYGLVLEYADHQGLSGCHSFENLRALGKPFLCALSLLFRDREVNRTCPFAVLSNRSDDFRRLIDGRFPRTFSGEYDSDKVRAGLQRSSDIVYICHAASLDQ